jgi:hypothetical protein
MTEKKSILKVVKASVEKQSKRNLSKQSLRVMPRICRLLEEVKVDNSCHTNEKISLIR